VATIVECSAVINAPVADVFAYVDDYRTTKDWMYGLTKIEPKTDQLRGVGATYDGTMKVGGRRQLVCPPELAYGPAGGGHRLSGKTLVFVIDLVGL